MSCNYPSSSFTVSQLDYDNVGTQRSGPSLCMIITVIVVLVFLFTMFSSNNQTNTGSAPRARLISAFKTGLKKKMGGARKAIPLKLLEVGANSKVYRNKDIENLAAEKDLFVILHAHWCGHCKEFLAQLKEKRDTSNVHILCFEQNVLEKLDISKNVLPTIDYFPMVLLFSKGFKFKNDKPAELVEDRTRLLQLLTPLAEGDANDGNPPTNVAAKRGFMRQNDTTRMEKDYGLSEEGEEKSLRETDAFEGLF